MKLLIIEDEINLAETLAEILKRNHYSVDLCRNGRLGWEYLQSGLYDGIILDIMLPHMDGYEILKAMRNSHIHTPVLVLTARSEMEDIVCGLDLGADDYMVKPFVVEELLARVRAVTRRKENMISEHLNLGNVVLDKKNYALVCHENTINLGNKEYQLMEYLLSNQNNIMAKELLIEKIWGYDSECEYNNIEVYISFLRKKLKLIEADILIQNTRGIGYYLEVVHD